MPGKKVSKFAKAAGKKKKKRPSRRKTPLWTPSKGITQSALLSFLNNPEEFSLNYIEGWTPKGVSVPLEFGTVIHLMEEMRHTTNLSSGKEIAAAASTTYFKTRSKTVRHANDRDQLEKLCKIAEALYPIYYDYWKEDDESYNWVARERVFQVSHTFYTTLGTPRTINLCGMRDGEFRNSKKELCLRETKTKSTIDKDMLRDALKTDTQVMFYIYSLYLEYGEHPTTCSYNIIRRPGLRQRQNESLSNFCKRIKKDVENRLDFYFWRVNITILPRDISHFVEKTLNPALLMLTGWWESIQKHPFDRFRSPYHIQHLPALWTKYGKSPLYDLMVRHDYNSCYQRSQPFPELSE